MDLTVCLQLKQPQSVAYIYFLLLTGYIKKGSVHDGHNYVEVIIVWNLVLDAIRV